MTAVDLSRIPKLKARELLGGELLSIDSVTGATRIRYTPPDALNNPVGTVLGGFTAAMIDDIAGAATWFAGGQRMFATAQMSTNFLRPVKAGIALLADATAIGVGGQQAFIEVRIVREGDGKLVATGTVVQTFIAQTITEGAKT